MTGDPIDLLYSGDMAFPSSYQNYQKYSSLRLVEPTLEQNQFWLQCRSKGRGQGGPWPPQFFFLKGKNRPV